MSAVPPLWMWSSSRDGRDRFLSSGQGVSGAGVLEERRRVEIEGGRTVAARRSHWG